MTSWIPRIALVVSLLLLTGCALLKPFPASLSTAERLKMFPIDDLALNDRSEIFWNNYQIPFIHTEDDRDVPYLLGMVHAHLRLGQMELLRRASQGRLAELFGPWAADIDHSLRILNFGKAVPDMLAVGAPGGAIRRASSGTGEKVGPAGVVAIAPGPDDQVRVAEQVAQGPVAPL